MFDKNILSSLAHIWLSWINSDPFHILALYSRFSHVLLPCFLHQVAVCSVASIALNKFVSNRTFDFDKLKQVTKVVVGNLNKIIDINHYPVKEVFWPFCYNHFENSEMNVNCLFDSNCKEILGWAIPWGNDNGFALKLLRKLKEWSVYCIGDALSLPQVITKISIDIIL